MTTRSGTNRQVVEYELEGQLFRFDLCGRQLELGSAGLVDYFWMDSRQFRGLNPGPNYRACIDIWWRQLECQDHARDPAHQRDLVWAETYAMVSSSRAQQTVYIDAHARPGADRESGAAGDRTEYASLLSPEEDA